jgi:hypothetical protein
MPSSQIQGQRVCSYPPENYVLTIFEYHPTNATTFDIDATADAVTVFHRQGGTAPGGSLGAASGGLKTVTLDGTGTAGSVMVVSRHPTQIAGTKP